MCCTNMCAKDSVLSLFRLNTVYVPEMVSKIPREQICMKHILVVANIATTTYISCCHCCNTA